MEKLQKEIQDSILSQFEPGERLSFLTDEQFRLDSLHFLVANVRFEAGRIKLDMSIEANIGWAHA